MMGLFKILFFICLFCSFAVASAADLPCAFNGQFQKIVYDIFGKNWADAQTSYGVAVYNKQTAKLLCEEYVQPLRKTYPASAIKTLIAVAVLKQVQEGKYGLDSKITINQVNAQAECKYWNCDLYGPGKIQSVKTLLWDMITVSNNLATNQLIDLASKPFINRVAIELGAPDLKINRKVYDDVNPEPELKVRNEANSAHMVQLYREVATARLKYLREDLRLHLVDVLGNQKYNSMLNAHFPAGIHFYHKTGNTSSSTGDGGFFYLGEDSVVVLVGLQDFYRYRVCSREVDCLWRTGFWSLDQIGSRTYQLITTE